MLLKNFMNVSGPFKRLLVLVITTFLVIAISASAAYASSQSFYPINSSVKQGMLVSLSKNPDVIEPATAQDVSSLVGVVAPNDNLSIDQQAGQIAVRTDGEANAIVSTLNGDILVGDKIAPSSLEGVGDKLTGSGWIVGVAQASLDASTSRAVKTIVSDSKGVKHTVYIASIPVLIKVTNYNASQQNNQNNGGVNSIQSLANTFVGKRVPLSTLVLSLLFFIASVVIAGMIIYSAIKGGMQAIARQPLLLRVIQHEVITACVVALLIIIAGMAGALLLLKFL